MKVKVPHNTTMEDARERVDEFIHEMASRYSQLVSDVDQRWENNRMFFRFKAKGMSASGTLDVTPEEIIVDGKLPFMALPFEGKIKGMIEQQAKGMFQSPDGRSDIHRA